MIRPGRNDLCWCGSSEDESKNNGGTSSSDSQQVLNTLYMQAATLDVNDCSDAETTTLLGALQEGLVRIYNDGNGDEIKPAGAESWWQNAGRHLTLMPK